MLLHELIEKVGPAKFARAVGVTRGMVSHLRVGRCVPSFALLARIRRVFPELDVNATLDAATRLGGRG